MSISMARRFMGAAFLLAVAAYGAGAQAATPQAGSPPAAKRAANGDDNTTKIEVYGFAMGDFIYDWNQNNPDWFDVNRPSKLPAFDDEFGKDHRTWFSARQSRFGVKSNIPTGNGHPDI